MSKLTLWSREGRILDRITRANGPADGLLDTAGTADWAIATLKRWSGHPIEYIVPVSHGAAVAGVRDGVPAFASPDYEVALPPEVLSAYRQQRDPFAETGSPALAAGLNFGAQLHALEEAAPEAFADTTLMPYAQYWAWLLTGMATSEVTSLGCHSDLWNPAKGEFSAMARRRGWAGKFAPLSKAGDVVGTLKPGLARETGLPVTTKVLAGLHDSNAALVAARGFPEIAGNEATVLSTGTWFIAMRLPAEPQDFTALREGRDCLVNVDADGQAVPSARFMGGREIETLIEIDTRRVDIKPDQPHLLAAVRGVVQSQAMVLPTLVPGNGPFPACKGGWVDRPDDWYARRAGACIYAALLADVSLDLIGSRDRLLIEGRFAEAEVFVRALASLRPDMTIYTANAHNDVSFGALRLIDPSLQPDGELQRVEPLSEDLTAYKAAWHARIGTIR
ncbi:FGGY-family carbohydrate kinase [Croceicoccus sp. YJ47]|uniref:FGGY-family carbohydrate kinase n=1 Tax=Croceicoccus sp. YJ47 TaxID=2798724 RepID=UPI0019248BD7|nr:carbohydrate kinase [Croceicoccus sp. YJ47]QQN74344.1 carbohydrate kinase [Croceicoccus sp. YJ47]